MPMTLREMHDAHSGKVCDKWDHNLAAYERIFQDFRILPVTMLEIGVQNGGSLELWSKYFGNGRSFIGCDVDERCSQLTFADERIHVIVGDSSANATKSRVLSLASQFDIIIDDGSHASGDIVKAFANYFPLLRDDGIYVAEDLHCSYWAGYDGGLSFPLSSISFFKRLVDLTNREAWGVAIPHGEILADFGNAYGCCFDAQILQHIYSVEFSNSLCVIRKRDPRDGQLGARRRAGREAQVQKSVFAESTRLLAPDQGGNPWAVNPAAALDGQSKNSDQAEHFQIARELDKVRTELSAMRASSSWRLTAPLRSVIRAMKS